jgi:hypothetical protein
MIEPLAVSKAAVVGRATIRRTIVAASASVIMGAPRLLRLLSSCRQAGSENSQIGATVGLIFENGGSHHSSSTSFAMSFVIRFAQPITAQAVQPRAPRGNAGDPAGRDDVGPALCLGEVRQLDARHLGHRQLPGGQHSAWPAMMPFVPSTSTGLVHPNEVAVEEGPQADRTNHPGPDRRGRSRPRPGRNRHMAERHQATGWREPAIRRRADAPALRALPLHRCPGRAGRACALIRSRGLSMPLHFRARRQLVEHTALNRAAARRGLRSLQSRRSRVLHRPVDFDLLKSLLRQLPGPAD